MCLSVFYCGMDADFADRNNEKTGEQKAETKSNVMLMMMVVSGTEWVVAEVTAVVHDYIAFTGNNMVVTVVGCRQTSV